MSTFDAYTETYRDEVERSIAFAGQGLDHFTEVKARRLLDLAARRLDVPAALTMLDVGCGTGETDRYLVGEVGALHGVDISHGAVEVAAQRNPGVSYQAYQGDRLPFDDGAVDLSFAICVMHHVPVEARRRFVDEMARVTRPGGLVAIFEHNPHNPLTRRAVSNCSFDEDAVLLRRREAAGRLDAAGLEVDEQAYIVFFPFGGERLGRLERSIRRLPLGAQYYVAGRRP